MQEMNITGTKSLDFALNQFIVSACEARQKNNPKKEGEQNGQKYNTF
jgi:hypothetical protein